MMITARDVDGAVTGAADSLRFQDAETAPLAAGETKRAAGETSRCGPTVYVPFVLLLETPPRGSLSLGARCFSARATLLSGAVRLPPRLLQFSFTAVCASAVCVFSRATRVPRPRALSLFLYRADARVRAPLGRAADDGDRRA